MPRGDFAIEAVRKVLLDLGWRSYAYVAQCVDVQMRFVAAAIPEPLNPAEQRLFDVTFLEQPFLADLPLILMTERIPALRAVLRLFAPGEEYLPDETLHAISHRLLLYYVQMSDARGGKRIDSYGACGRSDGGSGEPRRKANGAASSRRGRGGRRRVGGRVIRPPSGCLCNVKGTSALFWFSRVP